MKISILITNYNKYSYLRKTLNSVLSQNYKNFEIIVFDDKSTDDSVNLIKKFKKVKLILNKKKKIKNAPLLNQNNGIVEAFKYSKGKIICLLDSDDLFNKNKLSCINKFFKKNKNKNFVVNFPKTKKFIPKDKLNEQNYQRWPFIFPTSCISFRRDFFNKFLKYSKYKEFKDLGIDARLIMYAKFYCNDHNIIKNLLNTYSLNKRGNYAKYNHLGKNWWISRNEAFEYLKYILKLRKIKFNKSIDYYLTKLIVSFIKA